jgi:hypothetical protein
VTPDVGDGVTSGRPHRRRSSLHVRNNFNTELCRHSTKSEVWLVSWAYPPPRTTHAKIKPQRRLYSDLLKSTVAAACLEIKIEYGTRSRGLIWTRSKKARPPHLRAQMDYCRSQPREGLWARDAEQVRTMVRLKAAEIAFRELPRIAEPLALRKAPAVGGGASRLRRRAGSRSRLSPAPGRCRPAGRHPAARDPAQAVSHAVALTGVGD